MENHRILVIEDNELNMKLVVALLKIADYETMQAPDAETGIALARLHRPALILMDVQLPGMDGLAATRIIKSDEVLKQTPVVALTSYAMQGDEERAREAGCDGYISKPLDARLFLSQIGEFLGAGA